MVKKETVRNRERNQRPRNFSGREISLTLRLLRLFRWFFHWHYLPLTLNSSTEILFLSETLRLSSLRLFRSRLTFSSFNPTLTVTFSSFNPTLTVKCHMSTFSSSNPSWRSLPKFQLLKKENVIWGLKEDKIYENRIKRRECLRERRHVKFRFKGRELGLKEENVYENRVKGRECLREGRHVKFRVKGRELGLKEENVYENRVKGRECLREGRLLSF